MPPCWTSHPRNSSLPFWSCCLSPPLTASHWQLAPCQWHVVDGCHRCHCQKRDNAASNAGQREMKEAQRRGQANYSDTQLRADGDRAHQQPVWVINTFCHRRSHLCSERLMARRRGPAILGFYAKWMIEKGLRGWQNIIRVFGPRLISRILRGDESLKDVKRNHREMFAMITWEADWEIYWFNLWLM